RGDEVIVGVNKYRKDHEDPIDILDIDNDAVREAQVARIAATRAARDAGACEAALAELERREGVSGVAEKAARPSVRRADWSEDQPACLAIRAEAFIEEQGVPEELEVDGEDAFCRQYLGELNGEPLATARVRVTDGKAKIQRVAVRRAARGTGLGAMLMRSILTELQADPQITEAVLDAQLEVIAFYERLGFAAEGEEFLDAGIWHRRMRMAV
ncbi:MAG: GNAT family N-acetyltransferase, partial [Pseudomonadota bacterium]